MVCLANRDHSVIFETASKYYILDSLLTMMATPFLLRDSCPQLNSQLNSPTPVHFSSLIPKMLMFTLPISYLTASNFSRFLDLTFQVPMQHCSLQHWTFTIRHSHNSVVSTLAQLLHSFWTICNCPPLFPSSILDTF